MEELIVHPGSYSEEYFFLLITSSRVTSNSIEKLDAFSGDKPTIWIWAGMHLDPYVTTGEGVWPS